MRKSAATLLFITLVTVLFCVSPQAEAAKRILPASKETSISLTPLIGGYSFSSEDHLDPAFLYGVKLGYDIVGASIFSSLGIEATYNHFSARSKQDSGNVNGDLFRIDATYPFTPRKKVVPFVAVGMGGINIRGDSHTDTNPLLNYGAGVKYFYDNFLALRMDVRHLIVYNEIDTRNNYEVSFGVSYYFGKEKKPRPEPLPDQDQDGVPDNIDKCSNTPKGIKVDRYGCPVDSDKDGVADDLDKCAYSPVGVPVNQDGCPEDNRKNDTKPAVAVSAGIASTDDASSPPAQPVAPAPPSMTGEPTVTAVTSTTALAAPSAAVPAIAPPEEFAVPAAAPMTSSQPVRKAVQPVPYAEPATTEKAAAAQSQTLMSNPAKLPVKQNVVSKLVIEFTFDKFTISPDYLKKLQEFAGLMQSNPDMVATIEGHTDSLGSESYNLKLSRQRAESVKNSLLGFGAAADRVTTVGYGFSKPVASNATSTGRQRNRRAVTIVTFTRN